VLVALLIARLAKAAHAVHEEQTAKVSAAEEIVRETQKREEARVKINGVIKRKNDPKSYIEVENPSRTDGIS
jgi:hypothetical protein